MYVLDTVRVRGRYSQGRLRMQQGKHVHEQWSSFKSSLGSMAWADDTLYQEMPHQTFDIVGFLALIMLAFQLCRLPL